MAILVVTMVVMMMCGYIVVVDGCDDGTLIHIFLLSTVVVKQGVHEAWFLRSYGFKSCGQKEIAFLLEKRINEEVFPFEMLKIYRTLYSITLNQGKSVKLKTFHIKAFRENNV